jgi:4Fe-4S single cluster domain
MPADPGDRFAAEFEFHMMKNINLLLVEHCNLACAHCSTGSPFAAKAFHPTASFFKWLDLLEHLQLPFTFISLTGGEPFLHPEVRDGSCIQSLRDRYPFKRVGATTNFFWGNEELIKAYARIIDRMNGGLAISIYEPIVRKLGGPDAFNRLTQSLKDACPNTWITLDDRKEFLEWEFHEDQREVKGPCSTSDCFVLHPSGRLSHCSVAVGAQNIPRFNSILERSSEAFFDLNNLERVGAEEFLSWSAKYPFDLCSNCTMWRGKHQRWSSLR